MLLGIVFASLILGAGARGLAKAQSPDATSPPATPDSRPLQIDRGAQGAQNLKCVDCRFTVTPLRGSRLRVIPQDRLSLTALSPHVVAGSVLPLQQSNRYLVQ